MLRERLYQIGFLLLVIGLGFSRAFVSISYGIILTAWVFDKNLAKKLRSFTRNKAALALSSLYLLHLLGLAWTTDAHYALQDIRTKVALLIFPLVLSTTRPPGRHFNRLLLMIFALSTTASFGTTLFIYFRGHYADPRDAFPFVSHIRLSLMALIAISIFTYYATQKSTPYPAWTRILMMALAASLLWALFVLGMMTGILIFFASIIFISLYYAVRHSARAKPLLIASLSLIIAASAYLWHQSNRYFTPVNINEKIRPGCIDLSAKFPVENGSLIGKNICWKELKNQWNKRSPIDFDSLDSMGNKIKYTIIRYLNSRHLPKNSEGINSLSVKDIHYIEQGFANVEYTKTFSLKKRLYKIFWEYSLYQSKHSISKSSVIRRLSLWQNALSLLKQHPWTGVGTGDVKQCFARQLTLKHSPLAHSGLRSHNQYLAIGIAFGIPGILWFLFSIFFPLMYTKKQSFLLLSFLIIYLIGMLWEDSLETHIGANLYAFFFSFYLFWFDTHKD